MTTTLLIAIACGLAAVLYGILASRTVLASSAGNERMQAIAAAIQEGASAYLQKQYTAIGIVGVIVLIGVFAGLGTYPAIGFVLGAVLSGVTGFIGMNISVRANVRTAEAARHSLQAGLTMAFRSGAITGMLVAGLALLAIAGYFYFLITAGGLTATSRPVINALVALSFGASLISIFARLGGGIFTKAADVGADMVGKNELGFDEDDDRNPGVIADNVGDNVGDCAGMAADLFETYVVTLGATMVLIALLVGGADAAQLMTLPLLAGGVCIITSIIGTFAVRLGKAGSIMGALYRGFILTAVLSIPALYFATNYLFPDMHAVIGGARDAVGSTPSAVVAASAKAFTAMDLFRCMLVGLSVTGLIVWITEYYTGTGYRPVLSIARASDSGHGTNVIQGLAVSMESTALPTLVIVVGIVAAFQMAGLIGIAFAATSMLALAGMVVALDAYGPVTDNAGGIAEMSGLEGEVRERTDALDAVGNTTKAVTKGYAIGSAGLAALVLFATYTQDLKEFFGNVVVDFSLSNPYVVVGLLLGALLPYLFGGMAMTAVGRTAAAVAQDIRAQFRENGPAIINRTARPNYARTVGLVTAGAIREMIVPSLLPVLAPPVVYFAVRAVAGQG